MHRLLRGPAFAIQRDGRNGYGEASGKGGLPSYVPGLLAYLLDASRDHVIDMPGIQSGPCQKGGQYLCVQIHWVKRG